MALTVVAKEEASTSSKCIATSSKDATSSDALATSSQSSALDLLFPGHFPLASRLEAIASRLLLLLGSLHHTHLGPVSMRIVLLSRP